MKPELLSWLRCPACREAYRPSVVREEVGEIREGRLQCRCAAGIVVREGIPRFIDSDAYAGSFSFEWRVHARTQLDSANGSTRSEEQFQARLDVPVTWLKGKLVLDAGCGTGRFAEVAAKRGARVVGVDMSFAVDVAQENLRRWPYMYLLQADLMDLPFAPNTFDLIYCFGVLHHTPDASATFKALVPLLKPGGRLAIFVYSAYNKALIYSSTFWRTLTVRVPRTLLYWLCAGAVPLYYLYRVPVIGQLAKLCLVISMEPDWRWRWLDTFDWYAARYQSKHTHAEVARWFREAGLQVLFIGDGEVTVVGRKPDSQKDRAGQTADVWNRGSRRA